MIRKSLGLLESGLTGINRVDTMLLDGIELCVTDVTFDHIGGCAANNRLFVFLKETNTLYSRICSLIKLSGECFYRKYPAFEVKAFFIYIIYRRF